MMTLKPCFVLLICVILSVAVYGYFRGIILAPHTISPNIIAIKITTLKPVNHLQAKERIYEKLENVQSTPIESNVVLDYMGNTRVNDTRLRTSDIRNNTTQHRIVYPIENTSQLAISSTVTPTPSVILLNPEIFKHIEDNKNRIFPSGNYSVIALSLPTAKQYNYVYVAPLTVRAWRRLHIETIFILSGSLRHWNATQFNRVCLNELYNVGAYLYFLDTALEHTILISQTARLFAANLCKWENPAKTYLITSDVDLWPTKAENYFVHGSILSLNSYCCSIQRRHGFVFMMLPMCNIVMSVERWKLVMNRGMVPTNADEILQYFYGEFGDLAYNSGGKGEQEGWFLDQIMVSYRIEQWLINNDRNRSSIEYVRRDTGRDRLDRSAWRSRVHLDDIIDIHVLENMYDRSTWMMMFGGVIVMLFKPLEIEEIQQYHGKFLNAISY